MVSVTPDDTEVGDRLRSETPDLTDGLGRKTEIPLSGFGKPITGDIISLCMDAPIPNDTDVRDRLSSETPDLASGHGGKVSGFGKPITGINFWHVCSHERWDEDSSLSSEWDVLFVPVNHPVFHYFNSEFSNVYEGVDTGVPGDELVVLPEIFQKSDFVHDIGHCDVVGVALPTSHPGVASGGDWS